MFLTWLRRKLWQPAPSQRQRRPAVVRKFARPRLEPLEDRVLLSVYAVINTNDSGAGSLRQAILDANADTTQANTITFDIQGQGPHTIQPLSALPTITNPVTIDGTSQPGYAGMPLIELAGNLAGSNANGLWITAGNSVVRGLDIDRFGGGGIQLQTNGNDTVQGDFIGTDVTGTQALGNEFGVSVQSSGNTIGGTAAGAENVISANTSYGVVIVGASNLVQGNKIGTDVTGTQALGNGGGIVVSSSGNTIGGATAGAGNVISANATGSGVAIFGASNLVQGNFIGTDVTGTQALGNEIGIDDISDGNTIGGTAAGAGNVISANAVYGVLIFDCASTLVQGNKIGTDVSGTQALGNGGNGVYILDSSNNTIGGTANGAGNVISANALNGIVIFADPSKSATRNLVAGNAIGTDVTGTLALGNGGNGVTIQGAGASNNTIGGTESGAGNVISGNRNDGVNVASAGNFVQGNLIGTDVTGSQALGNSTGVSITAGGNVIGGTAAGAGNLISGNQQDGISLSGNTATHNVVEGNTIGTDISGTAALGNGSDGVAIFNGSGNTVGGTTPAAANIISANGGSGVLISGANATSNLIAGNFIGTDASATIPLGNAADGVTIRDASNNTIGGTATGAGNTIAFNGNDGVLVDTGSGNAILSDLIFSNGNLGIQLLNNGNNNQAAPILLSAVQTDSGTMIVGQLQSTPNSTFTLQFFSDPSPDPSGLGEGQQLLGTATVTTNAAGIATFVITVPTKVPAGQIITATATDANNNTSEFSSPIEVGAA